MRGLAIETEQERYTGGELVAGRCVVRLEQPLPVRGVRLRFQGFERSHWTEGSGKSQRTFGQTRSFFDEEQTLFGRPALPAGELLADALKGLFSRERYETLDAGEHRFDFSYVLPVGLPPDYESERGGSIVYEISARVDVPLRLDLSAVRRLKIRGGRPAPEPRPVRGEGSKNFLTDSSGAMSLRAALERDVVRPGERLRGAAEVVNDSGKQVRGVRLTLQRITRLAAGSCAKATMLDIASASFAAPEVSRGRPSRVELDFDVPAELCPTIADTQLVRVAYQVAVSVDVPWAVDLAVNLPVTVAEPEEALPPPPPPPPDEDPAAAFPPPPEVPAEPLLDEEMLASLDEDDIRMLLQIGKPPPDDDGEDDALEMPPEDGGT